MLQWLINVWRIFNGWGRAALNNAETIKGSRMLPAWLVLIVILSDFVFLGLWFRYTDQSWSGRWVVSCVMQFSVRLALVTLTLVWACRYYQVSGEALGIRPLTMRSDFRWAFRICALGSFVIGAALVTAFGAALWLGVRLPAPPESFVQFLGGHWSVRHFIFMVGVGTSGTMLVAATEELIYRSLFLPPLTSRFGLFPAVAVTSVVFGMAHVLPFGQLGIPVPEIVGGLLMAAGFSIRWSVVPAMVIHAMGNLFAAGLVFIYVRLFEACPTLFLGQ